MERKSLCGLLPDAGQAFEFVYEFCDRLCVVKHCNLYFELGASYFVFSAW
jgi:hypothetical protein